MSLADLGVDAAAEAVYRRLLGGEYGDIERLGRSIELAEEEVGSALARLAGLGLLIDDAAEPLGVRVPRPRVAVGQLIERLEDDLLRQYRRISDTRAVLSELEDGYVHGRSTKAEDIERLEGMPAIRERLEELSFFTRSCVYSVQPGGPQSKESLEASRPLDRRGIRRGLEMRVLHEPGVVEDELNRTYLRELVRGGVQVRLSREPLRRMVIMDREVAVVPMDPADAGRGALVVRQPGLVGGFIELFDQLWADAESLRDEDEVAEALPPVVAEQDRRVLQLLASGATDETSARDLGISVRHLRRTIARLMDELEASSRFEAGVAAARRGWI